MAVTAVPRQQEVAFMAKFSVVYRPMVTGLTQRLRWLLLPCARSLRAKLAQRLLQHSLHNSSLGSLYLRLREGL